MENLKDNMEKFRGFLEEISNINNATSVLHWDMATAIPPKGVERRSEVIGYLSQLAYKIEVREDYVELVNDLYKNLDKLDDKEKAMVKDAKKSVDFKTKIPPEEYLEYSILTAKGESLWAEAKKKNDYEAFKPTLKKIVEFNKKIAEYIGYGETPYDALLDIYEPGITVKDLDRVFKELRDGLVDILNKIRENGVEVDNSILKGIYPVDAQKKYNNELAKRLGFDFERGTIAESAHPFTINFDNSDVRFTTAYHEDDLMAAMYSTIHEGGHALYEQNVADDLQKTNIGSGVSMGIHESQSRFYENILGRSKEFLEFEYPYITDSFKNLKDYTVEDIYKAINKVEPSLIRIEADELTYSLHIIIRYEIEKQLINGEVDFDKLPEIWADKYEEYLGIRPKDYSSGILQDVHWSGGMIGYFPSYALGNLYGAQMFCKGILADIPDYYELVRRGDINKVTDWLKENVHRYGGTYEPKVLIEKISKEPLKAEYFLRYLEDKFKKIYNF